MRGLVGTDVADQRCIERHLTLFWISSLIAGFIWGFIPVLCDFCAGPQTVFYLTVVCGVTAGALAHGGPYARIPICFIVPPLLSILCCLLYTGGFVHDALAATVFIYALTLLRFARQSEAVFREGSQLKNEAVAMAQSLQEAHSSVLVVAEQMTYRAAHDGLTGLFNRSGFMHEVEARLMDTQSAFCMMLLDLDGFKSVNDVYGHHAGDKVLAEVARRLREALPEKFVISRLGGDEFAIFYNTAVVDGIPAELATRLVTAIEVPFASFDVGRLAACVGVYVGRGRNVTEMLTYADEALYVAKASGRNRHYIFDEILLERLEMRRDVERDLQRALSDNQVEVWYQPIFNRKTKELVSLEALLRWRHPRHGQIPPEELIMVAAMAGLAEALLRYVFKQVCSMIRELAALGFEQVRVAMNISPREISRLPIDEILLSGLQIFNLHASMLEIEITEETALDIRSVQDKLIRLARSGVNITIDDFGVGYSSLATLRQPYVGKIKIDYSFIRGITDSPENQILVQAILNLGRSLDVQVVAEGVESAADLEWLEQTGGDLLQGYFLRPPTSRKAVFEWLQQPQPGKRQDIGG
jgi:diguanylate cyclase (GGDEF)-like protein